MSNKYTEEELISHLQRAEAEIVPLTSDKFDSNKNFPAKSTISKRFGSWSKACDEAGVESGSVTSVSILEDIERLYYENEIENSEDFFTHDETPAPATFYKNFDSWRSAVDEVGINAFDHYCEEDLLSYIRSFEEEYGFISKLKFKRDSNYPSSNTVSRFFGSWNAGVSKAGLEPNKPGVASGENYTGDSTRLLGKGWESIRETALIRDDFTCRKCNSEKNLEVHHLKPRVCYRESEVFTIDDSNYMNNLVTLCKNCHIDVESGGKPPVNSSRERLVPRLV